MKVLSRLKVAETDYSYTNSDDGNINTETIDSTSTGTISYDGDLMTAKSGDTLPDFNTSLKNCCKSL